jgi:hypothetical protein
MSETDPILNGGRNLETLKADVLREVEPGFRASLSPKLSDDQVREGVETLFRLLAHRVRDTDLDAVGDEILAGFSRWFQESELVKLADRYEPFCKFLLRVAEPSKFAQLKAETNDRLSAAKVLKALGLVSNKDLSVFESCMWEQFPPEGVVGQPDFLEHVARTYVFRNVEDHRSRVLNQREKAQVAESFCVFVVWAVIKFSREIHVALLAARFSCYLELVRNRFADIGARFVELTAESRSAEEYRFLDPLSPLPDAPSDGNTTDASMLPEASRVTVIESEPGAGKTTTLGFLAWQEANKLLERKSNDCFLPVYVELKLLRHQSQSIRHAVGQQLGLAGGATPAIPWDSLLLLVDGINEVAPQSQTDFKTELHDLIVNFSKLRVVVAGRPNSFRGEFKARIVILRKLSEERLYKLFLCALADGAEAAKLLAAVLQSPFLSSWTRTPLHAAMLAKIAQRGDLAALTGHAAVVRRCVRDFFRREEGQSSATVSRTELETKELLLARLAFETKCAGEGVFSRSRAGSVLATAKAQVGRTGLETPKFLEEILDNHLLQRAENDALEFAHELYSDYFTAVELEAREQVKQELGASCAFAHFAELPWQGCIRLFAGLTTPDITRGLISRGAENNPWLAWLLLKDATLDDSNLSEKVALAAYSVLEGDLRKGINVELVRVCIPVLADLGRADLLEQAVIRQRQILEPSGLWKLPQNQRDEEEKKIQKALVPLGYGLISVLRLGTFEQRMGAEGRYSAASRAAIRSLKQISAARTLMAILASWTGKTFDPASLIPGAILDAILELGVDRVFNNEAEAHNRILVEWLLRASESGFKKAWAVYGRVLRLANPVYITGTDYEPDKALYWLRKAHHEKDSDGDTNGSIELALLLIQEPKLGTVSGEGERLLRDLAKTDDGARYELGKLLMEGKGLAKDEAGGFSLLLSLAETGYSRAKTDVVSDFLVPWMLENGNWELGQLPPWAVAFRNRLKALRRQRTLGQR